MIEMRTKVLKVKCPEKRTKMLTSVANLVEKYMKQGQWKEGKEMKLLIMETNLKFLEQEHPEMLTSIAYLPMIYLNQEQRKKADKLGVRVIERKKMVLGEEHSDTL